MGLPVAMTRAWCLLWASWQPGFLVALVGHAFVAHGSLVMPSRRTTTQSCDLACLATAASDASRAPRWVRWVGFAPLIALADLASNRALPVQIDDMIAQLDSWSECSEALIAAMEDQISHTRQFHGKIKARQQVLARVVAAGAKAVRMMRERVVFGSFFFPLRPQSQRHALFVLARSNCSSKSRARRSTSKQRLRWRANAIWAVWRVAGASHLHGKQWWLRFRSSSC